MMSRCSRGNRGSFLINLTLVLIILALGAIIVFQAIDLNRYLG